MAYTREQLEAMGAKPVTPQATTTPQAPKKTYTAQELQSLGATPVSLKVPEPPKKTGLEKTAGVLDAIFGFGKVGEAIGTQIAKARATPEERKFIEDGPKASQVIGSAAQGLLNLAPVGRVARGVGTLARGIGLGKGVSRGVGVVGTGAGTGYGYDVSSNFAQDTENKFTPGAGTAIGTALPLVPPALRGIGRVAGEGLGVSTGVGYGTIKAGINAASKGGDEADAFRSAMRGETSPEQIVDEARGALGTIIQNRTKAYRAQLEKLKPNTKEFDHTPIIQKFNKHLEDFGVTFDEKGLPDFSRSPGLGRYEKDLYNMSSVLKNWGTKAGDNTVIGIDKLKQVIDDFRIGSRDSQKFDTFVTALRNEAKGLIKKEPGYEKLVRDYEESTGLIKEIQRGLSLGDRAQIDTAFRKLTGALRTNNEMRKQLMQELDEVTGGTITARIAGQQMSEMLPRGLSRVVSPALGVGGVATGMGIIPILKIALFTSPRLVGEVLRALGYTKGKIRQILELIAPKGLQFPGDELYDRVMGKKGLQSPRSANRIPATSDASNTKKVGINVPLSKKKTPTPTSTPKKTLTNPSNDVSISKTLPKPQKKSIGKASEPVSSKKDPLYTEARKYKSAEEFVNNVSRSSLYKREFAGARALKAFERGETYAKITGKNPDDNVTVYRGMPRIEGGININDWVTLDKQTANVFAREKRVYGETGSKIVSKKVRAGDLYLAHDSTPGDISEFIYTNKDATLNVKDELRRIWEESNM